MISTNIDCYWLDAKSQTNHLYNLARVHPESEPLGSLTESIGFCSQSVVFFIFANDSVEKTPSTLALLAGRDSQTRPSILDYKEGTTWLEL